MSVTLKDLVKEHIQIIENYSILSDLDRVCEGEWRLARKAEYQDVVFAVPGENYFLQVTLTRTGHYHSGFEYGKPTYCLVEREECKQVVFTVITDKQARADELKAAYFDGNDDTTLTPVFESGWDRHDKVNSYSKLYEVEGESLLQTLYGNSDWTELVEYAIVEKGEEAIVSYKKIK